LALRRAPTGRAEPGKDRRPHRCVEEHLQPAVDRYLLPITYVIDDHSRVAYVEARDDETKETAAEVLRTAVAWFTERGISVQRVLTATAAATDRSFGATPAQSSA